MKLASALHLGCLFFATTSALAISPEHQTPHDLNSTTIHDTFLQAREPQRPGTKFHLNIYTSKDCAGTKHTSRNVPYNKVLHPPANFLSIKASRQLWGTERLLLLTNGKKGGLRPVGLFTAGEVEWNEGSKPGNRASKPFYNKVCANVYESVAFEFQDD